MINAKKKNCLYSQYNSNSRRLNATMSYPTDITYYKPTKFFLSCLGLWPHQSTMEKRLFSFMSMFFIITQGYLQIGGMIMAWQDTDIFMESIPPVAIDFVGYVRLINFIYNSNQMEALLLLAENDWKRYGVGEELKILRAFGDQCRKKTLMYAGALYGSMVPFMLGPLLPIFLGLFSSETTIASNDTVARPLMFHVEYLVNVENWYYYLLIHSYFGTWIYITIFTAIDTMLLVYVQHACSLFAIIGYRLEHLVENDTLDVNICPPINEDEPYKNIIECISLHSWVIEYVEMIEKAYNMSMFLQLGINILCLSFTGFQAVTKIDHPEESLRYTSFMVAQAFTVFIVSYPSQCLLTESMRIFEHFTNSSWYLTSMRTRKLLNLMILRSTRPCCLTAANFYVLDMQFFSAVIRTSMSYLTMLCSFR